MVTELPTAKKPVEWIASSKDDLNELPWTAKRVLTFAVYLAQLGETHPDAKPMKGFGGAGVIEVNENYDGNTYRAVYTIKFAGVVCPGRVSKEIQARQENAKGGYGSHQEQVEAGRRALQSKLRTTSKSRMTVMKKISPIATRSSGNVFADAGIPNATDHMLRARLVVVIMREIKRQHLNQKEAADRMGIKQPDVSRILRGDFAGFGFERLLRLAQKLGHDVDIKISRPRDEQHHEGRLVMHAQ
jgi:predicted XRE-type DNA-binding protein